MLDKREGIDSPAELIGQLTDSWLSKLKQKRRLDLNYQSLVPAGTDVELLYHTTSPGGSVDPDFRS